MELLITTTGTLSPVTIDDLGGRSFTHPTIDYNLLIEFSSEEIQKSSDLQNAISNGYVTMQDNEGQSITNLFLEVSSVRDISKNAPIWNANKIQNVLVNDSNIGDGRILQYNGKHRIP